MQPDRAGYWCRHLAEHLSVLWVYFALYFFFTRTRARVFEGNQTHKTNITDCMRTTRHPDALVWNRQNQDGRLSGGGSDLYRSSTARPRWEHAQKIFGISEMQTIN